MAAFIYIIFFSLSKSFNAKNLNISIQHRAEKCKSEIKAQLKTSHF